MTQKGVILKYYVYMALMDGNVVYIGKGSGSRYKHINSGISGCYEANKAHFNGIIINVDFYGRYDSQEEALEVEKKLIQELKPIWNIVHTGESAKRKRVGLDKTEKIEKQPYATSKFLGVSLLKSPVGGKRSAEKFYRAWCKIGKNKIHIGYFETEVEAAIARDVYIKTNGIEDHPLNFP